MDDCYLLGSCTNSTGSDSGMDAHKGMHADLQPGLELAAGAFGGADSAVADRRARDSGSSCHWPELLRSARNGSVAGSELRWWDTGSSALVQTSQMRLPLSAETGPYPAHSAARVGRNFRNSYSDKHSSDCQTCSKRTCRL